MINICIVLTLICYTLQSKEIWTPEKLAVYVKENLNLINPKKEFYYVIDPDEYLSEDQEMKMRELIGKIYQKRKAKVIFIVIHQMSVIYTASISLFVEEYANKFFNEKNVDDFMFILFSINDRQNRISTGEKIRKKFPDEVCLYYLQELTKYLQDEKYYEAFMKLLDFIKKRKKTIEEKAGIAMISFLIIFCVFLFGLLIVYIIECCKILRVQNFFDKIKDKKISHKIFLENCVICLEAFDDVQLTALVEAENKKNKEGAQKTIQNSNNSLAPTNEKENQNKLISVQNNNKNEEVELINNSVNNKEENKDIEQNKDHVVLNVRENNYVIQSEINAENTVTVLPPNDAQKKENESKENLNSMIEDNNKTENKKKEEENNKNKKISIISQISTDKISILECGHAFHKECLEEWMVKSNNCPLCREDINTLKDDEASKLGQGVLNIQDTLNPFFLSNLYFNAASFKIEMLNRGGSGGHFIGGFSGGMGGLGGASGRW